MNNDNNFFKKNGFSIALCSAIAIAIVASLYFSYNSFNKEKEEQIVQSEEETDFTPVNKSDVKSYKEIEQSTEYNTYSNTNNKTSENSKVDITTTTTTQKTVENITETTTKQAPNNVQANNNSQDDEIFSLFDETKEMSWPVFGNIVSKFDMDTAVYDKTLDQYKTSDSICISSTIGADVKAAAEGKVEDIFVDDELGQTVVINHGNGWISTYSQLEEDVLVAVGDVVDEGQPIGKIAQPSKYGVALGPHLDFKITKDDTPKNPTEILSQIEE